MKKSLTTILTLLFTAMLSSTSFAEWTKVTESSEAPVHSFYIDFDRIRKADGYIYFWMLADYAKPITDIKVLSTKQYIQGDCKVFRLKVLSYTYHKKPMGSDYGETEEAVNKEWEYPPPGSISEKVLERACQ